MSEATKRPHFEHFDRGVAEGFMKTNEQMQGLPGFLGARFVTFEPGRLVAELEARKELMTPFGNLHGGVLAAFVDHVLGCVLYPLMQRGQWAATTEFKINYLAPVSQGKVVAESAVVSMTRSTAVVRIEVSNDGRLAAIAQGTVLIRDPKKKKGA